MDPRDLRDPTAERRMKRLAVAAVAVLLAVALSAAGVALLAQRPADHHYRYLVSFENPSAAAYTLRVPLPLDGEWQTKLTTLGNGSAAIEDSAAGRVLRLTGFTHFSAAAYLDTWRDVSLRLTTEGPDTSVPATARVFFNTTAPAPGSFLKLSVGEIAPAWNTTRFVEGDLFEGWNTIEVREEQDHA